MSLLAIKRRRLYGKQPASQLDDVGPCEDDRLAVVTLPEEEAPAPRFDFLSQKTINTLVRAVLEKKTEQEFHSLTVATIMKDVLSVSTGQLTEEELNDKKDDFISAAMKLIPKELATRLVSAVKSKRVKAEADAHGKLVRIDSQTMQKSWLPSSSAPSREELQQILLTAFQEAHYYTDRQVTHLAIFREPHVSGGLHFHCATSLSQRCRWVPWKNHWRSATLRRTSVKSSWLRPQNTESSNTLICFGIASYHRLTRPLALSTPSPCCTIVMADTLH